MPDPLEERIRRKMQTGTTPLEERIRRKMQTGTTPPVPDTELEERIRQKMAAFEAPVAAPMAPAAPQQAPKPTIPTRKPTEAPTAPLEGIYRRRREYLRAYARGITGDPFHDRLVQRLRDEVAANQPGAAQKLIDYIRRGFSDITGAAKDVIAAGAPPIGVDAVEKGLADIGVPDITTPIERAMGAAGAPDVSGIMEGKITGSFARRTLEATDMLGGLAVGSVRTLRDSVKWMYPGKELYWTSIPPEISIPENLKRELTKLLRIRAKEGDLEGAAKIGRRLQEIDLAQQARTHWEERSMKRAVEVRDNPKKLLRTITKMRRQPGFSYRQMAEEWVTEDTAPVLAPFFSGLIQKALGVSDKEAALFGIGMTGDVVIDPINLIAVNQIPGSLSKVGKKIWGLKSVTKARSILNKLPFAERFKLGIAKGTRTVANTTVNMGGYPKIRKTILKIADEAGRYDFEAVVKQKNIQALLGKSEGAIKKGLRDILSKMGLKKTCQGFLQDLTPAQVDDFADFLGLSKKASRTSKLEIIRKTLEEAVADITELKLFESRGLPQVGQMTYAKVGGVTLKFGPGVPDELIDVTLRTRLAMEVQKGALKAAKTAKAKAEIVQILALNDFRHAKAASKAAQTEVNKLISEVLDAYSGQVGQAVKVHQNKAAQALAKLQHSRIARKLETGAKYEDIFEIFRREVTGINPNEVASKYMKRTVAEFLGDLTPKMRKIVRGAGISIDDAHIWEKMSDNVISYASKKPFVGSADLVEMMGEIRRGRGELVKLHQAMPIVIGKDIPKQLPRHVREVGLQAAKDIRKAKLAAVKAVKKGEAAMQEVLHAPLESIELIQIAKKTPVARNKLAAMFERSIKLGTLKPEKARILHAKLREAAKRMDELFRFDYIERAKYAKVPRWKPGFGEPRGYFKRLLNPEVREVWEKMPAGYKKNASRYFSPAMHQREWRRGQLISEINFAAEAGEFGSEVQQIVAKSGLWITNPERVITVTMDETARVVKAYRITKLATTLESAGGAAKAKIQLGRESMARIKEMRLKYPGHDIYLPSKEWAKHAHELDTVSDGMVRTINEHGALIPVDAKVLEEIGSLPKSSFGYLVPKPLARQLNYNFKTALSLRETNELIHGYDRVMNLWRGQALMWPSYHMRNLIGGNIGNMAAFGFKNPANFSFAWADMKKVFNKGWHALDETSRVRMLAARDRGVFTSWFGFEVQKVTGKMNPIQRMIQANRNVGAYTENLSKYAMFLDAVEQGKNFDEAANLALKAMHRYHDIPPAIAKLRRWGMPFVTWSYKNIPLQLEVAIRNPRYFATMEKTLTNISQSLGTEDVSRRLNRLGLVTQRGKDGKLEVMIFENFLPVADLEFFSKPVDEMTRMLSPLFKIGGAVANVDLNHEFKKISEPKKLKTRERFMGVAYPTDNAVARGVKSSIGAIRILNYVDALVRRNYGEESSRAWQEVCGAFLGLYTRKIDEKWVTVDPERRKRWAIQNWQNAIKRYGKSRMRRDREMGRKELDDALRALKKALEE